MHLEILVEERSAEVALQNIIPHIVGDSVSFRVITHQGKTDLLKKLAPKLKAYSKWITDEIKIVVLVDLDRDDCKKLKKKLNKISEDSGLTIKTSIGKLSSEFQILNRIAIEELEAWFFGDKKAIKKTYKKVNPNELDKPRYSNPDTISNTWEELERLLQKFHYYPGGLSKIQNAQVISKNMDVNNNSSKSFNVFRDGLLQIVS
jgi:integrase